MACFNAFWHNLSSRISGQEDRGSHSCFRALLEGSANEHFGLILGAHSSMEGLVIVNLDGSATVEKWNLENPESAIKAAYAVLEVNGLTDQPSMLQEFAKTTTISLLIKTELSPEQQLVYDSSRKLYQQTAAVDDLLEPVVGASTALEPCAICHEDLDARSVAEVRLPCGHHFHQRCVKRWFLSGHLRCPLCNLDLSALDRKPSSSPDL